MRRAWLALGVIVVAACGRGDRHDAGQSHAADSTGTVSLGRLPTDSLMRIILPAVSVALGVQSMAPRADSILAANGFTIDEYEATMYRIAADTAASRFFESALGR